MSPFRTPLNLSKILAVTAAAIFVVLPFHAFLTVWASSLLGHYTPLRLWKEFLIVILVFGAIYYLYKDKNLRKEFLSSLLVKLIGLYFLLLVLKTISGLLSDAVNLKAAGYGLIVDSRFLIFFLLCLVLAKKTELKKFDVPRWILIPAVLVSVFAILQYVVLPYDFLTHFGYGPDTIFPYQTINHDVNYLRAISTMRGANPLGAYLVLMISLAFSYLLLKRKVVKRKYLVLGLVLYFGALIASFSRSAWIGALIASGVIVWQAADLKKYGKILAGALGVIILVSLLGLYILRNNTSLDNALFHTNDYSTVVRSSNQDHLSAFSYAWKDVSGNPFGDGVGSAGPASVYNDPGAKISENYFIQIAQEAGWIGLGLFLAIYLMIGRYLWLSRADPLSLALFAALVGLSFVNLLSHAWTDDTLAYIFWGLCGIYLAPLLLHQSTGSK